MHCQARGLPFAHGTIALSQSPSYLPYASRPLSLSTPRPSPASPKVAQKIPNSKSRLIGFPPDEAFLNLASTTCWGQLSVGH